MDVGGGMGRCESDEAQDRDKERVFANFHKMWGICWVAEELSHEELGIM